MSNQNRGGNLPGITAGADLSASQFRFVSIDATGRAVLTAAGARIDGALGNTPKIDEAATINTCGATAKIESAGAVAVGDPVAAAAGGMAATAVAGNFIAGVCTVPSIAAGELISVHLTFPGVLP